MHIHVDWLNENYGVGFREMKKAKSGKTREGAIKEKPALLQDLFILGAAVIVVKSLIGA